MDISAIQSASGLEEEDGGEGAINHGFCPRLHTFSRFAAGCFVNGIAGDYQSAQEGMAPINRDETAACPTLKIHGLEVCATLPRPFGLKKKEEDLKYEI